ncbi:protein FREE1-like isoform X2 [Magnolia sinica]|uniref:protein FREE1-like isoform X2 n=1 Tax=Magnolia sinica TaxID=86752 RepID=UPI00265B1BAA|nr:protein FREE1-like isoform X2 [Magnolia sinica]
MQQGGDFSASYSYPHHQNPNPNPNPNLNDLIPPTFASAPPFSHYPSSSDPYSSPYPSFSQNPDPVPNLPPTAPSYSQQPPLNSQPTYPPFPPATATSDYPPHLQQTPPPTATSDYPPHLQQPPPAPYYLYDHHPTAVNYPPANSSFSVPYSPPSYPPPPVYENHPYDTSASLKFDRSGSSYLEENSASYGYGRTNSFPTGPHNDGLDEGVYAYDGGRAEPYGARGTGAPRSSSSSWSAFDDYGRSTSLGKEQQVGSGKIVRAVPKAETQQDVKNGVQKFRVKLLPESSGQSTMDVLCQIGLDGIRMLDPSTSRTLRIYPLETVTRWEVNDSSIYTFWAKSSVDFEPRRIRLQSNSYTTNTILDAVTAATVQLKEMGGSRSRVTPDASKQSEQPTEKKKGLADWMNLIKPGNEEKDHWVPDEAVSKCTACGTDFGAFVRKHHCRNCGDIFCDKCTHGRIALTADEQAQSVRVCDRCLAEVSQRLSNAKETSNKSAAQHSHEDLARKLQVYSKAVTGYVKDSHFPPSCLPR